MNKHIAIYYSNIYGRNDGPPLYWFNAMQTMGLDVTHLLAERSAEKAGPFDLHVWVDWGEDGLPWEEWYPPKDGGKTVYVASDTHLGKEYRFEKAKKFEYVFFNQERARDEYLDGEHDQQFRTPGGLMQVVDWLPHAAEPQAYPHTVQAQKFDVCFIGHLSDEPNVHGMSRVETLDRVFRAFSNFYFGTRSPQKPGANMFEDAARRFNQSRIVLNHAVRDDLNMRFFEVLCSGAFLLTTRLPDAESLGLREGEHYAAYASYDEAIEKINHYLNHPEERERIARAGHEAVMAAHTYRHRVRTMLETVGLASLIKPEPGK